MITELLKRFSVDQERGFLPNPDPFLALHPQFKVWDELGAEMPSLLAKGDFRSAVENLPLINADKFKDNSEVDRAMLLLSMFANAYISCGPDPVKKIPLVLAVPLTEVAKRSGRPPISSHASIVLNNWARINPKGPIELENIRTIQNFLGGQDEDWFFLTTVMIEYLGAPAISAILKGLEAAASCDNKNFVDSLESIGEAINNCTNVLDRIPEKCDPHIFYTQIRPFLAGWPDEGIIYEGVSDEPKVYIGGSAAQSSLLQSIDAAMGIFHPHSDSGPFLKKMRKYMPPAHRKFIEYLETQLPLKKYVEQNESRELNDALNRCINTLDGFRKKHMQIVVQYIFDQVKDGGNVVGTGGTDYLSFLSRTRTETSENLLS
ncbi:MAG: indoleamine 2,3-dioxygenase [Candidatus Marinimicrobia bacterium]|nr:indoleamine 2,3-dioxygenase [Candidatus Neomarinimicrobiota bacterium]